MKKDAGRILVYAEDPGAVNYLSPIIPGLRAVGCFVTLIAGGLARCQFAKEGVEVDSNSEEGAEGLIDRYSPSLVVVGTSENSQSLGLHLVDEARRRGINSVGVVDGNANAQYRFAGNSTKALNFAPNLLLVPDSLTKASYVSLGMNADSVIDLGHPHFDKVWEARNVLQKEGKTAIRARLFPRAYDRKVIVFVSEISTGLNPQQYRCSSTYTLKGLGKSDKRTDIVLEELILAITTLPAKPYFVVRLHPKNTVAEFSGFTSSVDQFSQYENPQEVVFAADLVVGMTSHLLSEAAFLKCRTLSVLPRAVEREWLSSDQIGTTQVATTSTELRTWLFKLLYLPDEKFKGITNEVFTSRGAVSRCVDFISLLVSSNTLPD